MPSFDKASNSVFEFENLSEFLGKTLKKQNAPSIRALSARLGYKSDRSLGLVIQKKRKPNRQMVLKLGEYFQWTSKEQAYAQAMVDFENTQDVSEQKKLKQTLDRLKLTDPEKQVILGEEFHLLKSWFCFPILNLVEQLNSDASIANVVEAFPLRQRDQVEQDIEHMLKNGFLKFTGNGVLSLSQDATFRTTQDIPSKSIREYHKQNLKQAELVLEEQSVLQREFLARTMNINSQRLPAFKKRLREVVQQLDEEFCEKPENADAVFQLNLQLFQVAETPK